MYATESSACSAKVDQPEVASPGDHYPSPSDNEALIFLHVYKTGGTTLNRIIEWEYRLHQICSLDPNGWQWHYRRILRWPPWRLNRTAVFKGHMPFGLHTVLGRPAKYVTLLRDPVERAISDYYFARSFGFHIHHRAAKQMSLEEYFVQKHEHNLQCHVVAGPDSHDVELSDCGLITAYTRLRGSYVRDSTDHLTDKCDDIVLARAKRNLARHFAVVGLTERYDETLALLKVVLGWKIKRYRGFRATPNRLPRNRIPASTLELIQERERFDLVLYEFARAQFEKALAERRMEIDEALQAIRAARQMSTIGNRYYFYSSVGRAALSRAYSSL